MAYIVAFNKATEACVVFEPTFEQRMQLIIMDNMPTMMQLEEFYRNQYLHDRAMQKDRIARDHAFDELIDMALRAENAERHIDRRNRELLMRLRNIIDVYLYKRIGYKKDIYRFRNSQIPNVFEIMSKCYGVGHYGILKMIDILTDPSKYKGTATCAKYVVEKRKIIKPESAEEQASGSDDVINIEKSGDVTLTTARTSDQQIMASPSRRWSHFVSNDVSAQYSKLTERWLTLGSFEWNIDARQSQIIYMTSAKQGKRRPILPFDAIWYNGASLCDIPNLIPFKVHSYWRGDMEIKVQVNSNKFQIGQLLCTFYYQPHLNSNISDKVNVFSASQLPHCIIQASASNEASLMIPYNNVYPMIPTRRVPTIDSIEGILNLGELWIMVQNPLRVATGGPSKCYGSVLIRFLNSEFTGLSYGGYCTNPESAITALIDLGMKTLDQVRADANRDAPTNITPSMYVTPTTAHSWSLGRDTCDQMHVLRLSPRGQTRHGLGTVITDEMDIHHCAGKEGLVYIIDWLTEDKHKRGTILAKIPAAPDNAIKMQGIGAETSYVLPPVGIIASLFQMWRGTLKYRITLTASQFHTGRLLVGYIPGYVSGDITIKQLKSSPHSIFDLQEQREFIYEVPYISYRPWWNRQHTGNYIVSACNAPSTLVICVYNELIVMNNIPNSVYINVYVSAGSSFEVAVPVQPSISLSWHKNFVYPREDVTAAIDGYAPYYYGSWHSFQNGNYAVARWGSLSDQIAEMLRPNRYLRKNQIMYFRRDTGIDKSNYPAMMHHVENDTVPSFALIEDSGHGYAILIPVLTEENAWQAASAIQLNHKSLSDKDLQKYFINLQSFQPGRYSVHNPHWIVVVRQLANSQVFDDYEIVTHESDDISALSTLASTGSGLLFFGEQFIHLKDLCRRYQMYCQVQIQSLIEQDINKCAFNFHVMPQGLSLAIGTASQPNELFNRCREGIIPIVCSLFRYYRGSLRFRICFPPDIQATVWIQHRPDRRYIDGSNAVRICHKIDSAQGVFNHGYAFYLQNTPINGVIEFEVPYYNTCVNNLLQQYRGNDSAYSWCVSLGQIQVGIEWIGDITTHQGKWVSIYYAFGDDMRLSQWVGGSQYLLLDDNYTASPEAPPEHPIEVDSCIISPAERTALYVRHEGWKWQSPVDYVADRAETVVKKGVDEVRNDIATAMSKVVEELGSTSAISDKTTIAAMVGNLLHIAVNPVLKTMVVAVVNIFVSIGILGAAVIHTACDLLTRIFSTFGAGVQTHEQPQSCAGANPESDSDNTVTASWCSLLFGSMCGLLNVTTKRPTNMRQWTNILTQDMGNIARGANQIFIFIRNTMDCIRSIMDYILGRTNKDYAMMRVLETDPDVLKNWCKEILYLTDPGTKRDRIGEANYCDRVFDAQSFGQLVLSDIGVELRTDKNTVVLSKLFDKITSLKDELLEMGQNPHVRKLPFTIYMYGAPGIGKSYLSTALSCALLKSIKYTTKKGLKCTINPQSDFWDQCEHQPVLEIDDLWAVSTPNALEKQLLTLFQVCSPIVLSPPKAAVEEKKMRYNPEIFYINSNKDFPVYNDIDKKAIWRRRDVLVKASLSGDPIPGCPHCWQGVSITQVDPKWLVDFHHLRFQIAEDVCDPQTAWSPLYRYEQFLEIITEKFIANRLRESQNFTKRVEEQEQLTPKEDMEGTSILNAYMDIVQSRQYQYQNLYNRYLKDDICKLASKVKDNISQQWITMCTRVKQKIYFDCESSKPESDGFPSEYARIGNVMNTVDDSNGYSMNALQVQRDVMDELVNLNVLFKYDVDAVVNKMRNIGDDGEELNRFLKYYINEILKMYRCIPQKVSTVDNILKFICDYYLSHDKSSYCNHVGIAVNAVNIYQKVLTGVLRGKDVDLNKNCEKCCIFNSVYMKYMWHSLWLKCNPSYRLCYAQNNLEGFPEYMCTSECKEVINPDNIITQLYLYFKLKWNKYVSPVLSQVIWWLKNAWPKIMHILTMFGFVTLVSGTAAGGMWLTHKRNQQTIKWSENLAKTAPGFVAGWSAGSKFTAPESAYALGTTPTHMQVSPLPHVVQPQHSQQCTAAEALIKNNTVIMRFYYSDTGMMDSFRCVMMRGRQMLALRHYLEIANSKKDKVDRMSLIFDYANDKRTKGCEIDINWFELNIRGFAGRIGENSFESGYILIDLPPHIPEFKSLVKFICPRSGWSTIGREGIMVIGAKSVERNIPIVWSQNTPMVVNVKGPTSEIVMGQSFRYPIHGAGMCGSILMAANKECPIVGMHVAGVDGVNGFGLAEPLYREMIDEAPLAKNKPIIDIVEPKYKDVAYTQTNVANMIYGIGVVDEKMVHHQSTKTQIKPSKLHGLFEVRTSPNPLSRTDPRLPKSDMSPLEHGCSKHGLPNKALPADLVERARMHLQEKIIALAKPITATVGVQSEQVAVCGDKDIPEFVAMNMRTSAGVPLMSLKPRGAKGKRWLFDLEETSDGLVLKGMDQRLRKLIDGTLKMRSQKLRIATVFNDCLKDTTLVNEKCTILGKTRVFSVSPVQYTIPFRQYMLDFMGAYRRARLNVGHAIGIDVNSSEWTELAIKIQEKGPKLITGDYSNYGPSLNAELVDAAISIILEWYKYYSTNFKEEDQLIRNILLCELNCAYHQCTDYIYRVPCGIPSGSPITDILNSIVGNLYIYIAWMSITGRNLIDYEKYCNEIVYGDDIILNVSDTVIDIFNGEALLLFFQKYLIKFTDVDKTGKIIKFRNIDTASFLKCQFKVHPYRHFIFTAALDQVSIEGCLNWIKPNGINTDWELTLQNAVATLNLAYGQGKSYFNSVRKKILDKITQLGQYVILPTWEELDVRNFETPRSNKNNIFIEDFYILD